MNRTSLLVLSGAFGLSVLTLAGQQTQIQDAAPIVDPPDKPTWAYAVAPGARTAVEPRSGRTTAGSSLPAGQDTGRQEPRAPDPTLRSMPGSTLTFTLAEVRNAFAPADWFPEDHPSMPDIVAHGRRPDVRACAFCHMPNGKGRPENAPIAGLPKGYIVQQLLDFKSGARKTAEPRKPNDMGSLAPFLTDEDIDAAAAYFSSMPWTQWIRVVETDTVEKTRVAGQMYHLVDDGTTEPIGVRIVEAPEEESLEALRAPRSGFVAYVPTGSIQKGEELVTTGGGKTTACVVCHGPDLHGVATIPGLANRSPSYLGRQLWDFKTGARHGSMAPLMRPVVEKLTNEDIVNILAYTASRKP